MKELACAGELCNVQPETFLKDSFWLSEAKTANVCICNIHKAAPLDVGANEGNSVQPKMMRTISHHGHLSRILCKRLPALLAEPAEAENFSCLLGEEQLLNCVNVINIAL